jgi:hypothetical protein
MNNFDAHVTGIKHRMQLQKFGDLLPPVSGPKVQVFFDEDDVDLDDDRLEYAPVRAPSNVSYR